MANYATLKAAVQAVIKTNGNEEITGANLQSTLLSVITSLGTGYQFMGVATPSTSPGTPDYNVAYIGGAGTYANFGTSVTVPVGSIGVFKYNGSWASEQIALFAGIDDVPTAGSDNFVKSGGVANDINKVKQIVGDAWKVEQSMRIANGIWYNDFGSKHIVVPISGGDNVVITPATGTSYYYSVLNDYQTPVAGVTPSFATGYSDRILGSSIITFVAPEDALWLYFQVSDTSTVKTPTSVLVNGIERMSIHSTLSQISTLGKEVIAINNTSVKKADVNITIISENLANPANIQDGKFINSTGGIGSNADWSMIKVPVEPNTKYTFGGFYLGRNGFYANYNESNELISYSVFNDPNGTAYPVTITTPNNTAYLYFDIKTANSPSSPYTYVQVNKGEHLLPYDEFSNGVNKLLDYDIFAKDIELRSEFNSSVLRNPKKQSDFFNSGYIKYSDGTFNSGGYICTDFIKVNANETIKVNNIYGSPTVAILAAYSTNVETSYIQEKSIIGTSAEVSFEYVITEGVNYVRLCCYSSSDYSPYYGVIPYVPYISDSLIASSPSDEDNKLVTLEIIREINNKPVLRLYPQTKLPCVSFQFDDIPTKDSEIVTLFKSYGLTCAFAFIASEENINSKAKKYLGYQKSGFQIMNHSINGTIFNTTNYTYQTATSAIMTALNRIQNAGMVCNGFVSPSSQMASDFLPILKFSHAYAFTTSTTSATANGRTQDTCQLHRYSLQSNTLAQIEQYIDDCITNDQIMTFYGHAADLVTDGDTSVFSIARIAAIIEYCIAKRDAGLLYIGGTDDCVKYFFNI